MLALTRRTEYGVIALCHLARSPDALVSARGLAKEHGLRQPLAMNVLKALAQAGLVRSVRGARGGYSLAVPAAEISLKRVIRAIEGPVRLVRCADAGEPPDDTRCCELMGHCAVQGPLLKVHERVDQLLAEMTLAELASDPNYGWTQRSQLKVLSS